MNVNNQRHRVILQDIAHRAMLARGLLPDFSKETLVEMDKIQAPAVDVNDERIYDMRDRLWASIDNDDSRDLDQLTVAEALPGDVVKIWVAVADVDSLVKDGSAIDKHARHNTTSVYTAAKIFPMLPSTGIASSLAQVPFSDAPVTIASNCWPIFDSSSSAAADLPTCRSTLFAASSCAVKCCAITPSSA